MNEYYQKREEESSHFQIVSIVCHSNTYFSCSWVIRFLQLVALHPLTVGNFVTITWNNKALKKWKTKQKQPHDFKILQARGNNFN